MKASSHLGICARDSLNRRYGNATALTFGAPKHLGVVDRYGSSRTSGGNNLLSIRVNFESERI
jgi:hypothetical protein